EVKVLAGWALADKDRVGRTVRNVGQAHVRVIIEHAVGRVATTAAIAEVHGKGNRAINAVKRVQGGVIDYQLRFATRVHGADVDLLGSAECRVAAPRIVVRAGEGVRCVVQVLLLHIG